MAGLRISELPTLSIPTTGTLFLVTDMDVGPPRESKGMTMQTVSDSVENLIVYNGPNQICKLGVSGKLPTAVYDITYLDAQLGVSSKSDINHTHTVSDITDISTITSDIATNTSAIATNASDIATNTSAIATNTSAIATNASAIATNASDIATNASAIATNTSAIATNTSDIATLSAQGSSITSHTHLLSAITNAGTAGLYDVGVSADNVVQLDGNASLPAVDASQLLNVPVGQAVINYSRGTDNQHLGAHPDQPYRSIDNDYTAFVRVRDGVLQVVGPEATTTISVGIVPYDDPEEPDIEFILPSGLRLSSFNGDSDQKGTNNLPIYQQYRADLGSNPAHVLIDGGTF